MEVVSGQEIVFFFTRWNQPEGKLSRHNAAFPIRNGKVVYKKGNWDKSMWTGTGIAPCVLHLAGLDSPHADRGDVGSFLAWMERKRQPVFVVITANNPNQLPPELLGNGLLEAVFYVDLPNQQERAAIWDMVLEKHGRDKYSFDSVRLARATEMFTGTEIERVFVDALYAARAEKRDVAEGDIGKALVGRVPLYASMSEEVERMRQWARCRARRRWGRCSSRASATRFRVTGISVTSPTWRTWTGDRVPNVWQRDVSGSGLGPGDPAPASATADGNADGDRWNTRDEYVLGLDPMARSGTS